MFLKPFQDKANKDFGVALCMFEGRKNDYFVLDLPESRSVYKRTCQSEHVKKRREPI